MPQAHGAAWGRAKPAPCNLRSPPSPQDPHLPGFPPPGSQAVANGLAAQGQAQEQRDMISLDMEAYQSYIEEYKTDAFCKIFEEFSKNPQNTKILEDALDNPDLKMNELLQIAIVSSVLEDNSLFQETRAARAAAVNCYDQYIGDRKSCAGFYIASAGAAFLFGGGVPGLIAGTVLAVASLDACLDTALRDYRQCRGR